MNEHETKPEEQIKHLERCLERANDNEDLASLRLRRYRRRIQRACIVAAVVIAAALCVATYEASAAVD
jgi:negative regulator of sigma E activity